MGNEEWSSTRCCRVLLSIAAVTLLLSAGCLSINNGSNGDRLISEETAVEAVHEETDIESDTNQAYLFYVTEDNTVKRAARNRSTWPYPDWGNGTPPGWSPVEAAEPPRYVWYVRFGSVDPQYKFLVDAESGAVVANVTPDNDAYQIDHVFSRESTPGVRAGSPGSWGRGQPLPWTPRE